MVTISFAYSNQSGLRETCGSSDVIIIGGSVENLTLLNADHLALQQLDLTSTIALETLNSAISMVSPSKDDESAVSLLLPPRRKVVVSALPTACSRHNTPSKSHAVSSIVKAHKLSDNAVVLLLPTSREHAYAQAIAVARQFPLYTLKSKSGVSQAHVHVIIHLSDPDSSKDSDLLSDIQETAESVRLCQRLVDAPPNVLHTDAYVAEAASIAASLGCKIEIIQGDELDKRGFGGIAGVGRASARPPAMVVLSHIPAGMEDCPSICLVGKGIVYDTGGLSIKVPPGMAGMKVDMGGSSAVLGAFITAVKRNIHQRIHAFLCIAENSVGPLATRPDDIHTFLSGKTVEINNTDAEGRLVLADGCYYAASQFNPKIIMDMATLTGAQGISTGMRHGAIYCTDDELEALAMRVGKATGDLTMPIVYCPEFHRAEFKSAVADMKNSVANRTNAQSSCAAQFVGNHIEDYVNAGGRWLHCDMAYPAHVGDRGTGYGVALFYGLIQEFARK